MNQFSPPADAVSPSGAGFIFGQHPAAPPAGSTNPPAPPLPPQTTTTTISDSSSSSSSSTLIRYNIVVDGGAAQQGQGGFIVPGRGLQTVQDLRAEAEKRLQKRGALRDGDVVDCLKVPVGGILSALNMRRVTKQRERTMTRAMRRTEWALAHWPWDLSAAGSGLGLLGRDAVASAREATTWSPALLSAISAPLTAAMPEAVAKASS